MLRTGMTLLIAGLAVGASAQPVGPLQRVQPGQWLLKEIGAPGTKSLCLADPARVLQIGHGDAKCSRTIVDRTADTLTVSYTCPGTGSGRSTITVRTPSTFRLQTQGLAGGAPFEFDYEARRTGDCAAR